MILKSYPAKLSLAALICTMGTVEGTILAFAVEWRNTSVWLFHLDSKFIAAIYGVRNSFQEDIAAGNVETTKTSSVCRE